jgi:competence protein ComEA
MRNPGKFRVYGMRFVIFLILVSAASPATTQKTGSASGEKEDSSSVRGLVDINRATVSELKTLPGIRDAYAAAIVKNRPYKNKAQLLSKQVIPEAAYGKIRKKIIARQ